MKALYLLDAYALIYRAYYALIRAPRVTSKGVNTSAAFGFVNTLEELMRLRHPDAVAVAFDPSGPTFRHEAYPDYKAQRESTPEDIRVSVPLIKDIVRAYRIPILEVEGYEADDVIGSVARQAQDEFQVYMVTPDKDYGQLITPRIKMCKPAAGGFEETGAKEICAKYGIRRPDQIIDLLALMGDSSDNIPGCPGVGEKTAARLLSTYDNIEDILAHTDQLKGVLRKRLEDNAETIRFSRFLATIKTDIPLPMPLADLSLQKPDLTELRRLFTKLEFRSLIGKVEKRNLVKAVENQLFPTEESEAPVYANLRGVNSASHYYKALDTEELVTEFCRKNLDAKKLGIEISTRGEEAELPVLTGIALATAPGDAVYVPLPLFDTERRKWLARLAPLLESKTIVKVGHNLKTGYEALRQEGASLALPCFDTLLAHYLLSPETRHTFTFLAEQLLNYHPLETVTSSKSNPLTHPDYNATDYACERADLALQFEARLCGELPKVEADKLLYEMEMPLLFVLGDMELQGIRIDTNALQEAKQTFQARLRKLESDIFAIAGHPFSLTAPRQVGEVLFEELKLSEKAKKTKTGQYATSEEILEGLRPRHPIVGKILDHRALHKLLSTYVEALPKLVNRTTGRIHTSFNQAVTATGRLSSSNPNLQNIPVRGEDGREIRKAFLPEPGCTFLAADYSQIELRIMAHLSQDAHLIAAFLEGKDIHAATAACIFRKPIGKITPDERRKAKTANFGIIYGISAFGLASRLEIMRTEARKLIDDYFAAYPDVHNYMDSAIDRARRQGYIETLFGRRRYLPDINSRNATVRAYAERNAINAPIQGTAADIIKRAMVGVAKCFREEGIRSKLLLQVHDELDFSVWPEELERVQEIVKTEMETAATLRVPLVAECGIGENWLAAH